MDYIIMVKVNEAHLNPLHGLIRQYVNFVASEPTFPAISYSEVVIDAADGFGIEAEEIMTQYREFWGED